MIKTEEVPSTFIYVIATLAGIGGLLFGYDTGAISGALLFIKKDFLLTTFEEEITVAALLLCAAISAPFAGFFADRYGRKPVILASAALFFSAAFLMALAPNFLTLISGRALVGVAIGVASMTVPLYVSELSPPSIRGLCVAVNQFMVTIGILAAYGVDYYFAPTGDWRMMLGVAAMPAALLFLSMLFFPETPRWLLANGKKDRAIAVFRKIGTKESEVEHAVNLIESSAIPESKEYSKLWDPALRPPLFAGVMLAILQQVTGINTIIYYAPTLLSSQGHESTLASILSTVGIGTVNVIATAVALYMIDRAGRRPLLFIGTGMMVASLAFLGISNFVPRADESLAFAYNISLFVYIAGFAIGLGPIAWLFIAEAYPQDVRGVAMSVATLANWGANFLVALTFLSILNTLGAGYTFLMYAFIGLITIYFIYRCIPETRGKTLEEIQNFWESKA